MPLSTEGRNILISLAVYLVIGSQVSAQGIGSEAASVVGDPYAIDGTTYRPADGPSDEVGYAGFLAGGAERGVRVAHKTLPLPSFVEITDLATGRTILARVTERGPMANDRLIDMSCGAARQLGVDTLTPAQVRIRRVSPPPQERAAVSGGGEAAERLPSPKPLLTVLRRKLPVVPPRSAGPGAGATCGAATQAGARVTEPAAASRVEPTVAAPRPVRKPSPPAKPHPVSPEPVAAPASPRADGFIIEEAGLAPSRPVHAAPAPAAGEWLVQVGAFASRANAEATARRTDGHIDRVGALYRVRTSAYATRAQAEAALSAIRAKGFAAARLVAKDAR